MVCHAEFRKANNKEGLEYPIHFAPGNGVLFMIRKDNTFEFVSVEEPLQNTTDQ